MPGTLYVVATPIGNLEDITFRAVRILKEVDLVAAEDTRHSRKLFSHYGISTPLLAFHEHNEQSQTERLLEQLSEGRRIALISDAGTPAIADPGYRLVRRCREEGVAVQTVPGPVAAVAALSVAGLPTDRFVFEGFLPAKAKARREALRRLRSEERTSVFYETPHRLGDALADLVQELGEGREVAVARELTKLHEELVRGSAAQVQEHFAGRRIRGEIVLLVGPDRTLSPERTVEQSLRQWLEESELPLRQVAKEVAREFSLPGSEVYRRALRVKEELEGG